MRLHRIGHFALLTALAGIASTAAADDKLSYPPAAKRPVSETLHGVTVIDDYRWLEDNASPEVKAWVREQNALTRKVLDAVAQRPEIARRVGELMRAQTVSRHGIQYRGGIVFALKDAPPNPHAGAAANADVTRERIVVDPTALDPSGRTAIDFYKPSYDRQACGGLAVLER
jgi:prolyl oligopeptidase